MQIASRNEKKIISQTIIYTFCGTLLFTVLSAVIMGLFTEYSGMYITAIITFVISNILIGLSNALSRGLGKIKLYSVSNFILGISTIILNIIFILGIKAGAEGLFMGKYNCKYTNRYCNIIYFKITKIYWKIR